MQLCCKHNNRGKIRLYLRDFRIGFIAITFWLYVLGLNLQCKFHTHVIYRKKEKQMAYAKSDNGGMLGIWHNDYEGFVLREEDVELVIANYERATQTHFVFHKKDGKYGKSGTCTQVFLRRV